MVSIHFHRVLHANGRAASQSHRIQPIARMGSRPISLPVLMLVLGLATARPSAAQESAFLTVVKELAATRSAVPAAADRMTAALAEWDREIGRVRAQLDPKDVAVMLRRRGRLEDALRQFDRAAAAHPGDSEIELLRALTLDAAGRLEEARRAYQAAWARDPSSPAKAYLALRRMPENEAAARERARIVLRDAYRRILSGGSRPAAPAFPTLDLLPDTLSRTPTAGDGRLDLVFAHLANGRLDDAVTALRNTGPSAGAGDSASARIARGGAAERDGRLADARREYAAALQGTLSGRYALHVGIARLAQVEGDSDAAIDAFEHAVRLSPNDPGLRRELAAGLAGAGRFDDAFAELVAALLVAPGDAEVLAAVGQLFVDSDRPGEAIAPLRRALAVNAGRYQTHYALAVALSRAGKAEEAAHEFEQFDRLSRQAMDSRRRAVAGQGPDGAQR